MNTFYSKKIYHNQWEWVLKAWILNAAVAAPRGAAKNAEANSECGLLFIIVLLLMALMFMVLSFILSRSLFFSVMSCSNDASYNITISRLPSRNNDVCCVVFDVGQCFSCNLRKIYYGYSFTACHKQRLINCYGSSY